MPDIMSDNFGGFQVSNGRHQRTLVAQVGITADDGWYGGGGMAVAGKENADSSTSLKGVLKAWRGARAEAGNC